MEDLISLESLIKEAEERGVDFGKGDPYNRLRYYTKIGWLPHMIRKKDDNGRISGHYYSWAIDRLITIEEFKKQGLSNDEISKKLNIKTKLQVLRELLKSKETQSKIITYSSLVLLLLIFLSEFGVISFGTRTPRNLPSFATQNGLGPELGNIQFADSGTAFIAKNQKKVTVQTPFVKKDHKVYVTFTTDYSPAARYWVAEIESDKHFTLELDAPVFDNAEFNWWITN